jgi:hypothetical protein
MHKIGVCSAVCTGIVLLAACGPTLGCRGAGNVPASAPAPSSAAATAAAPADISGTYTLVSINGTALPYTMTHEAPGVRVTSGTFTLRPDGTCSSDGTFVLPSGQAMSRAVSATWTRDGARLTMTWEGAGTTIGTLEGDTFTMDNEGQIFAYRRLP